MINAAGHLNELAESMIKHYLAEKIFLCLRERFASTHFKTSTAGNSVELGYMEKVNKTVIFRSRGGPSHGWGNIYRLLGLAEILSDHGFQIIAFVVEGPGLVTSVIEDRGFRAISLPEDVDVSEESSYWNTLPVVDICIVEMLRVTAQQQINFKQKSRYLVIFDDLLDNTYQADLVICGQLLPGYGNVDLSSKGTKFLLGYDYFMFSRAFSEKSLGSITSIGCGPKRLLVTLGGGDYFVGYEKIAWAVQRLKVDWIITFILGPAAKDNEVLKIKDILPHAKLFKGVDDMASQFSEHDFAVVSAGYSKLEALISGLPTITIATQYHQIPLGETFEKQFGIPFLGYMSFVSIDTISESLVSLEARSDCAQALSNGMGPLDGQGAERVVREIKSLIGDT